MRFSVNGRSRGGTEKGFTLVLAVPPARDQKQVVDDLVGGLREHRIGICLLAIDAWGRSEEHTSELQSLMRISYAVFCLKKKKKHEQTKHINNDEKEYKQTHR